MTICGGQRDAPRIAITGYYSRDAGPSTASAGYASPVSGRNPGGCHERISEGPTAGSERTSISIEATLCEVDQDWPARVQRPHRKPHRGRRRNVIIMEMLKESTKREQSAMSRNEA